MIKKQSEKCKTCPHPLASLDPSPKIGRGVVEVYETGERAKMAKVGLFRLLLRDLDFTHVRIGGRTIAGGVN